MSHNTRSVLSVTERFATQSRLSDEVRRLERLKSTAFDTLDRLRLTLSIVPMDAAKRDSTLAVMASTRTFISTLDESIKAALKSVR